MIFENIIGNQKNKKILEDIIIKNKKGIDGYD